MNVNRRRRPKTHHRDQQGSTRGGAGTEDVSQNSREKIPCEREACDLIEADWRGLRNALAVAVVLAIVIITTYVVVIPGSSYTGPKHSTDDSEGLAPKAGESKGGGPSGSMGRSCKELMDEAKRVLDQEPRDSWEDALDLLATCALQEPDNAASHWNLAVALVQMGRVEEAIDFIDQAISLDRENLEYLKTGGALLSKNGYHQAAIKCLELYLELALHVPSWERLLARISIQREDEWMFLEDTVENIVQLLEVLLMSYLQDQSLIKAGYLYKVVIGLRGFENSHELVFSFSQFSIGLGDLSTGIKYLRRHTEHLYVLQGYGDDYQAFEVVTAHSLRLFTAGFDAAIVSIAKNLLLSGQVVWDELAYNCNLDTNDSFSFLQSVSQSSLRRVFTKCLIQQDVINHLVQEGAVVYAENIFGWTPLLHLVALGSHTLMHQLLRHNADPQTRTVLGHTSLHVIAMRGSHDVTLPLLQAGLRKGDRDYRNRTALDVACLHRWSAEALASALNTQLPHGCLFSPLQYSPPVKPIIQGGWLGSGVVLPSELTAERCDFDVVASLDANQFLSQYLSLQRPVLVRDAAAGSPDIKALFHAWQRNRFEQMYGELQFKEVTIPYAESFGGGSNLTTVRAFMAGMRSTHQQHKELDTAYRVAFPTYIFEPTNSELLLKHFSLPSVLNPNVTHISSSKFQFYLGPALSGAPVHFHRSAWNLLVYGEKRWFLFPPNTAFYSKQHVWDWWQNEYIKASSAIHSRALECVQHPGDLVFVPEMWGHGVINLRESVGLASEFVYGSSEFSI